MNDLRIKDIFYSSNGRAFLISNIIDLTFLDNEKSFEIIRIQKDSFLVDDAREINFALSTRPSFGNRKIIVLSFRHINEQAQNAFLKTIELIPDFATIFLITENTGIIIPTLNSRLEKISFVKSKLNTEIAEKFIEMKDVDRMKYIEKIIDSEEKKLAIDFLDCLEDYIYYKGDIKKNVLILSEIEKMRGYLFDKGSSIKMILSHIALLLDRK